MDSDKKAGVADQEYSMNLIADYSRKQTLIRKAFTALIKPEVKECKDYEDEAPVKQR